MEVQEGNQEQTQQQQITSTSEMQQDYSQATLPSQTSKLPSLPSNKLLKQGEIKQMAKSFMRENLFRTQQNRARFIYNKKQMSRVQGRQRIKDQLVKTKIVAEELKRKTSLTNLPPPSTIGNVGDTDFLKEMTESMLDDQKLNHSLSRQVMADRSIKQISRRTSIWNSAMSLHKSQQSDSKSMTLSQERLKTLTELERQQSKHQKKRI